MPKAAISLPSREYLREALAYNPATGVLRWKERPRHHFNTDHGWRTTNAREAGHVAGVCRLHSGYRAIGLEGQSFLASRIIWKLMTGEDPPEEIDHKNEIRSDDRWENLRVATQSQNLCNQSLKAHNLSGFKGASLTRTGRYGSEVQKDGVRYYLGTFDTAEEAHVAYVAAAKRLHGEFANAG